MGQSIIQGPSRSRQPRIEFGAALGGTIYRMAITWNSRMKWWAFDLRTARSQVIFEGNRIMSDIDMLQPYNMPERPNGQIICHDTTGQAQPPTRFDFIERHILLFVDPEPAPPGPVIRITRHVIPTIPQ